MWWNWAKMAFSKHTEIGQVSWTPVSAIRVLQGISTLFQNNDTGQYNQSRKIDNRSKCSSSFQNLPNFDVGMSACMNWLSKNSIFFNQRHT